jgi:hypothetical protein
VSRLATAVEAMRERGMLRTPGMKAWKFFERALALHAPEVAAEQFEFMSTHGVAQGMMLWAEKHGFRGWTVAASRGGFYARIRKTLPNPPADSEDLYHAEWLVLYQYRGMSMTEVLRWEHGHERTVIEDDGVTLEWIENRPGGSVDATYQRVRKGIRRFADKIGLTLRQRGRPGRPRSA